MQAVAEVTAGFAAANVVRPTTIAEVADVLRQAKADRLTVVPAGGRTKLGWAAPPTSCDLLLDTTGLDRIVEHQAGDLVVVAEAGVPLAGLQRAAGVAGQWLALDPPETDATLGGVVSANASGPRRLRFGTARDLLIGITVVLADGSVASAGGKVVKNVAGYDLCKLYTGAHGTLGVVVSTTWRLHPVAPARRVVVVELAHPRDAAPLALRLARSTLTPVAVELLGTTGGTASLVVLFEAAEASVTAQATAAVTLLGTGTVAAEVPTGFGERPGGADDLVVRMAFAPASLADALAALPDGTVVMASACTGVAYAALPAADALPKLREDLAGYDGSAVAIHVPDAVRDTVDHWGPIGDSLDLMRAVKQRFDPERRLCPGRFVGGI